MAAAAKPAERKKRTITEIRDSKHTGEKMVYTSVLDYTSAKWAEAAGVDVVRGRRQPGDDLRTATRAPSRRRWT